MFIKGNTDIKTYGISCYTYCKMTTLEIYLIAVSMVLQVSTFKCGV